MSLETEAQAAGERRHETCEHGMLTPSFRVDLLGNETPGLAPLCLWRIPEPCPRLCPLRSLSAPGGPE